LDCTFVSAKNKILSQLKPYQDAKKQNFFQRTKDFRRNWCPCKKYENHVNWDWLQSQRGWTWNYVFAILTSPACKLQVGLWLVFWTIFILRDLNGLGDLLLRCGLRHGDGQDAVLNLGRNLVFHHIVWQHVVLLVVRVAELTAQIVTVTVLMLVFLFVLNGDGEVLALQASFGRAALVIDAYSAIFLLDAWSCKFFDERSGKPITIV